MASWNWQTSHLRLYCPAIQGLGKAFSWLEKYILWNTHGFFRPFSQKVPSCSQRLSNLLQRSQLRPPRYVLSSPLKFCLQTRQHYLKPPEWRSWLQFQHATSLGRRTIWIRPLFGASLKARYYAFLWFYVQRHHLPFEWRLSAQCLGGSQAAGEKSQELSCSNTLVREQLDFAGYSRLGLGSAKV